MFTFALPCLLLPDLQKVKSPGRLKLESWLNACMKIEIEDGRTLIGQFLCTDRDSNIILGSCYEYPPVNGIHYFVFMHTE